MNQPSNTVVVEDAGPARKRVSITIPAQAVTEHLEEAYSQLQSSAALPGFRPGKAPRAMLVKRFGKAVAEEARGKLLEKAFGEAAQAHALKPLSAPQLAEGFTLAELALGTAFSFSVELEVVPEFTLPAWEGLAIQKPTMEIADKHIDDELRRSSYRFGTPARMNGPFERLDRMVGHATVRAEGVDEPILDADGALTVVPAEEDGGTGPLLGLLIENLDKTLLGKSVGDVVTIESTGPESHEREDIRGKKLTIEYRIMEGERITPATNDELATKFNLASLEMLKEQVKMALEQRRDGEQAAAMREQATEQLADLVDFPLPERISADQAQRDLSRREYEMLSRGVDPALVEREMAAHRAESVAASQRRLKLFFILARLAEELGVEVSDAELNGRVAMMARQRNVRPDKLRAELTESGAINELATSIREAKTADRVVSRATVTDVPAEEWNKIVEARTAAKRGGSTATASTTAKPKAKAKSAPKSA
ncbi:MAG: trigger factor [Planctomycetota bacterium]|nr:trigger factor [Planctomycetota bacterium]